MSENRSPIPSRLYNAAKGGHVAGAADIIDDDKGKTQDVINQETDNALENRYTKEETYSKTELNNLITTPNQEYVSVTATDETTDVTDILPATGEADTIYRVGNWDGTQYNDSVFSEYAWNGSAYIKLSTKSQIGEVYDISANHAGTTYANLTAALGVDGANIPQSLRKGGMSIKFVRTSDNKYIQARCMAQNFTTDVTQWQGVDNEPIAGSNNLVNSGGAKAAIDIVGRDMQGASDEITNYGLKDCQLLSNGKFGASRSIKHAVLRVYEGEIYDILFTLDFGYIAFATTEISTPNADIPLVSGTTIMATSEANEYKRVVIPEGCTYLLFSYTDKGAKCYKHYDSPISYLTNYSDDIKDKLKKVLGTSLINKIDGVLITSGRIKPDGTIDTNNSYSHSEPFEVSEGDCLVILGDPTTAVTPMSCVPVSTVSGSGTEQDPYVYTALITPDDVYRYVIYKFTQDAIVAVSYRNDNGNGLVGVFNSAVLRYITENRDEIETLQGLVSNIEDNIDKLQTEFTTLDNEINGELISPEVDKSDSISISSNKSLKEDSETGIISIVTDSGYNITNDIALLAGDKIDVYQHSSLPISRIALVKVLQDGSYSAIDIGSDRKDWSYTLPEDMTVKICTRQSSTAPTIIKVYTPAIRGEKSIINDIKKEVNDIKQDIYLYKGEKLKEANAKNDIAFLTSSELSGGNKVRIEVGDFPSELNPQIRILTDNTVLLRKNVTAEDNIWIVTLPEDYNRVLLHYIDTYIIPVVVYNANNSHDGLQTQIYSLNDKIESNTERIETLEQNIPNYKHELATLNPALGNGNTLSFLVAGDPHRKVDNMQRFCKFASDYSNYLTDVIHLGDVVGSQYREDDGDGVMGIKTAFDDIEGFPNMLAMIGNHDVYNGADEPAPEGSEYSSAYWASNERKYNRYFKFMSNWGTIVQPTGVNDPSSPYYKACYYYKDYSVHDANNDIIGIRYIVLDSMDLTKADGATNTYQELWFEDVLDDAATNHLAVICGAHRYVGTTGSLTAFDSNWTDKIHTVDGQWGNALLEIVDTIQKRENNPLEFICWMFGHAHRDSVGCYTLYPSQCYVINTSLRSNAAHSNEVRLANDKSYDSFNVISVDLNTKYLRLLKIGCEYSTDYKHKHNLIIDYINHVVVSEN